MTELKGYIKYIKYINDDNEDDEDDEFENEEKKYYLIAEIIDENNNDYIIKGNTLFFPEELDEIVYNNCFLQHNIKYNKEEYTSDDLINISLPSNNDLIKEKLIKLNISGYKEKKIDYIVTKYGSNVWDVDYLKKLDDKIIKEDFISSIEKYISDRDKRKDENSYILDYLIKKFNISLNKSEYEKVKKCINDDLKENIINNTEIDNLLLEDFVLNLTGYIGPNKIDKICKSFNLSGTIYDKIEILNKIRHNINLGSPCIMKKYLDDIKNIDELLSELYKFIFICGDYIYDIKQYNFEQNIAYQLKKIYNYKYDINSNEIIEFADKITLNEEQLNALYNAFNNPISIITGGPGYGKTTTIRTILEVSKLKNYKFTILAPTGKVVSKITNDLGIQNSKECRIMTIHKFIGIFKYEKKNKNDSNDTKIKKFEELEKIAFYESIIKSNFIIIDEFSMVSNRLFSELLDYIIEKKIRSKIILIGDCNQLPSIDCGNVLDALISSKCIPITNLIKPMRQKEGSGLIETINLIKEGSIPNNNDGFKFIKTNNDNDFKFKLLNLVKDNISKHEMSKLMLITPTRSKIKNYTNDIRDLYYKNIKMEYKEKEFSINDHIILTKNIYMHQQNNEKYHMKIKIIQKNNKGDDISKDVMVKLINSNFDLFNGMIGVIKEIKYDINKVEYYVIDFYNNIIGTFEKKFFNSKKICDFSYINTVHKYQGSENKIALVLLNNSDKGMANRNLIYTAVSRAKDKCIVIGEEMVFHKAINKKVRRLSKLNEMIREKFIDYQFNRILDIENINTNVNSNKKGIPTIGYNDILFRSRIEAKWSYFFNILKWKNAYEPFDLNGYIPDFIIKESLCGNIINLLVEVKGDVDDTNFNSYYEKAWVAGWHDALLILNSGFENTKDKNLKNGIVLGQLYFPVNKNNIEVSDFIIYKDESNLLSHVFSYNKKYYNIINKKCILDKPITIINNTEVSDNIYMHSKWISISNQVQFKKPEINDENIRIVEENKDIKMIEVEKQKQTINNNINNQLAELEKNKLDMINKYNIDSKNINVAINEYNKKENELCTKLEQLEKDIQCFYCNSDINKNFSCIQHNHNNLLDYNNCFFVCKCCNKLSIKVEITKNYNKKGCFNCNGCEFCIKGLPKKPKEHMYIISLIKCLHCDNNINYNYNINSNINSNINNNINNIPKTLFNKKINDITIKATIDRYKDNIINIDNTLENNIILTKKEIEDVRQYISELNSNINTININHKKSLEEIELKIEQLSEKIIESDNDSIASLSNNYSTDSFCDDDNYNDYTNPNNISNKCYNCGQAGHYSNKCTNKKKINSNCYKWGKQGH